ncbi:MAG: hypothetical protein FD127_1481 [Acidimicrobiaceae bacterium]|nr:MAG: hypothetical protein FD127_1481 [Acidimicrobiaceae bacterium]
MASSRSGVRSMPLVLMLSDFSPTDRPYRRQSTSSSGSSNGSPQNENQHSVLGDAAAISSAHFFHSANGIVPLGRFMLGWWHIEQAKLHSAHNSTANLRGNTNLCSVAAIRSRSRSGIGRTPGIDPRRVVTASNERRGAGSDHDGGSHCAAHVHLPPFS